MPRLHKHIKDTAADALAFHGNLLGKINLHNGGTLCVDHIQSAAPYFGLTAATPDGAADLTAAIHQHLCSFLTLTGDFALHNGRHSDGFTGLPCVCDFLKNFSH